LRDVLAAPLRAQNIDNNFSNNFDTDFWAVRNRANETLNFENEALIPDDKPVPDFPTPVANLPLGKAIGQIGNKYVVAQNEQGLVIVDQHAAHERIIYEKLRRHEIKRQPLLLPIVIKMKPEKVIAALEIAEELKNCGIIAEQFGDDTISIQEKPADWDLDWGALMNAVADEVLAHGHSVQFAEKLHLKLANYACHHSVRAGQKLDMVQMDALLRDIENTERGGECNHGRPVYKIIPSGELDGWFERG